MHWLTNIPFQEELGGDNGGMLDLLSSKLEESQSTDDSVNELYVSLFWQIHEQSNEYTDLCVRFTNNR